MSPLSPPNLETLIDPLRRAVVTKLMQFCAERAFTLTVCDEYEIDLLFQNSGGQNFSFEETGEQTDEFD